MLKSLDVLIGLTVIMLALSMAVTMLTQFITTVVNSRGRHLKRGLADLIRQLDPALRDRLEAGRRDIADTVAGAVLTHPLISASGRRLGSIVHREEFTKLLLSLTDEHSTAVSDEIKVVLKNALARNGIPDPAATLGQVRNAALTLEAAQPHLAADVRQTMALLQEARSDFTGKINSWFDQTIDRVSQRFTASTRGLTFAAAALVAIALQVDALNLVNRLAANDQLRQAFVQQAASISAAGMDTAAAGRAAIDRQYLRFLADNGLLTTATTPEEWWMRWDSINLVGVLVTALMLSLGAPFWYGALGKLLQLRSTLAAKDDNQRNSRQAYVPPKTTPPAREQPGAKSQT